MSLFRSSYLSTFWVLESSFNCIASLRLLPCVLYTSLASSITRSWTWGGVKIGQIRMNFLIMLYILLPKLLGIWKVFIFWKFNDQKSSLWLILIMWSSLFEITINWSPLILTHWTISQMLQTICVHHNNWYFLPFHNNSIKIVVTIQFITSCKVFLSFSFLSRP